MKILGIETSCDDTGVAIVEDGRRVLVNILASQTDLHRQYGGVVPEIAARSHIETIIPVIQEALDKAEQTWGDIDAIAVTQGPGLNGSLLIGVMTATTLAHTLKKPLYAVNHVLAHTYANFLIDPQPTFPLLSLSASGSHSHLVLFQDHFDYRLIGETRDDAAGEAFDKVARLLGLPNPNGQSLAKAAEDGDEHAFEFPKAKLSGNQLDFSFSGLKTAVLRKTQELAGRDFTAPSYELATVLTDKQKADLAASFQRAVVETLTDHLVKAYEEYKPKSVVIAGGVSANTRLREEVTKRLPLQMHYAPIEYCTDNGAMIATLAYFLSKHQAPNDPLQIAANPSLSI